MSINIGNLTTFAGIVGLATVLLNNRNKDKNNNNSNNTDTSYKQLTVTKNKLTVATGDPAYKPWVIGNEPESGVGFESAVIYAIANELGYGKQDVKWVRTTFDDAIKPGKKNYDINIQQVTITDERKKFVDFSSPYYTAPQAIVSFKGSKIDLGSNISLQTLKGKKIGAAYGTTSLDTITNIIKVKPIVFKDNAAAVSDLKKKKIDGIVVDLPTAFYLLGVEITNGIIVGQIDGTSSDKFGLVLEKNSKLTPYFNKAIEKLRANGTLRAIEEKWLRNDAGAPFIKL